MSQSIQKLSQAGAIEIPPGERVRIDPELVNSSGERIAPDQVHTNGGFIASSIQDDPLKPEYGTFDLQSTRSDIATCAWLAEYDHSIQYDHSQPIQTGLGERGVSPSPTLPVPVSATDTDAIHRNLANEFLTIGQKISPSGGDLILIEDSEDSSAKKKIAIASLPSGGSSPSGLIVVAKSGGDFDEIEDAMAVSPENQLILVYPGDYAPITTVGKNANIRVRSLAAQGVRIVSSDETSPVTVDKNFTLRDITVVCPSVGTNPAINTSGMSASSLFVVFNCVIQGGGANNSGLKVDNGLVAALGGLYHNGGTLGSFVEVTGGIFLTDFILPNAGVATNALLQTGGVVEVAIFATQSRSLYNTVNLVQISNGVCQLFNVQMGSSNPPGDNALLLSGNTIDLLLANCALFGQNTDIAIDEGVTGIGTEISFSGVFARQEKVPTDPVWWSNISPVGSYVDPASQDDPGSKFIGEVHFGNALKPSEVRIGTGDSTTLGMKVFTDDGTGTNFINVTPEASSPSGSTFTLQGLGANQSSLYIGTQLGVKPTDIKVDQTVAAALGTGFFSAFVWTGEAYEEINFLVTETIAPTVSGVLEPRRQYAQQAFTLVSNRIRIDSTSSAYANWEAHDPGTGETALWVLFRNPSAITTLPVFQRLKVGYTATQYNSDGSREGMGLGARINPLFQGTGEDLSSPTGGTNSPGNLDVNVSANVSYRQRNSNYNSGNDERAGTQVVVPPGLDTSRPLTLKCRVIPLGTDVDQVDWQLYVAKVKEGEALGIDPVELPPIASPANPPGVSNQDYEISFMFHVEDLVPGDIIAFNLWRFGSSDPNTDNQGVLTLELEGYFWS